MLVFTLRVVVPGSFTWQANRNTAEPPPGSAMAVAKHIMGSVLTQFGDRRLFLFVFGTDYGVKCRTVFTALAHGLMGLEGEAAMEGGDGDTEGDLNETSIVKYFIQVSFLVCVCVRACMCANVCGF